MSDPPQTTRPQDVVASAGRFAQAFLAYGGRRVGAAAGLVVLGGVLENVGLLLLIPILNLVTGADRGGRLQAALDPLFRAAGAASAPERLTLLLAVFVGLMLLRAAVLYARDVRLADLQTGFVEAERNRVIRRLAAAPWSRVAALRHARVTNLLGVEIQRVGTSAHFVVQGAVALAILIVQSVVAFSLAPRMTLVAAVLILAGGAGMIVTLRRARDVGVGVGQASQALMSITTGFLGGLKAAVAQNTQAGFVGEFQAAQAQMRAHQLAFIRGQTRSRLVVATVSALAGAVVVWFGFRDLAAQPAVLITVILVFARMTGPLLVLQQASQQLFFTLPAFDAIRMLEAELADGVLPPAPASPPLPAGAVVLEGVSFAHPGGGGLAEADLALAPGTFLGVTGPSGAGKTTFVDLLAGVLAPQTGRLTVGGAPLTQANLAAWRNTVAYVAQDPFLFHDTVRRNLTWGDAAAEEAALWRVLDAVGAADLVRGLGDGLDTVVGERGTLLSGGERQRIALARALLREPRLLVLDEATNAIDVAGEADLLARLAALEPRPTVVMVAHRAESLVHCDGVVQIEQGRLRMASQAAMD